MNKNSWKKSETVFMVVSDITSFQNRCFANCRPQVFQKGGWRVLQKSIQLRSKEGWNPLLCRGLLVFCSHYFPNSAMYTMYTVVYWSVLEPFSISKGRFLISDTSHFQTLPTMAAPISIHYVISPASLNLVSVQHIPRTTKQIFGR